MPTTMDLKRAQQRLTHEAEKRGLARNTIKSYNGILARYVRALEAGHCAGLQTYLDHVATVEKLSASSIKSVVCGLVFYIKNVLRRDPGPLVFPRSRTDRRAPVCLSLGECHELFQRMSGLPLLQSRLMLGAGLRISECLTLRLKDLNFSAQTILLHGAKGDKDRTVPMPRVLVPVLEDRVQRCLTQHRDDRDRGIICPVPSKSLRRKLGEATFGRASWYWLFPSTKIRGTERWHTTDRAVARSLKLAADRAGILRRVCPHVMRHSFATAMLRNGTDIRTLQDLMGHADIRTTMRYLHAEAAGLVTTPLDMDPSLEKVITFPSAA